MLERVAFPPPRDLLNSGMEPMSPALGDGFFTTEPLGKPFTHRIESDFFIIIAVVHSLGCVTLFATPRTSARQASLSIASSQNLLKLMSVESVMPSISSSVVLFSTRPRSFPASGFFPMSRFFASGGQSFGASASVLPVNLQG